MKEEVHRDWALRCIIPESQDLPGTSESGKTKKDVKNNSGAPAAPDFNPDACENTLESTSPVWVLEQRVFIENMGNMPIVHMAFQKMDTKVGTTRKEQLWAVFRVPLGIQLASGLTFQIDEKEPLRIALHHCRANGCLALMPLSADFRKSLEKGVEGFLAFQILNGQRIRIPISLMGIKAGLNALGNK